MSYPLSASSSTGYGENSYPPHGAICQGVPDTHQVPSVVTIHNISINSIYIVIDNLYKIMVLMEPENTKRFFFKEISVLNATDIYYQELRNSLR